MKDIKAYGTIGWEEKIKDDLARLQEEYPEITYDQVKSIVLEQFGKKFNEDRSYLKTEDATKYSIDPNTEMDFDGNINNITTTPLNSDLQGLSKNDIENLEFSGIAKQIVNKWLCQALDKNDSKAVREACIVLKAMKRQATFWSGDRFTTLNFDVALKEGLDLNHEDIYSDIIDQVQSSLGDIIVQGDYDTDDLTGGDTYGSLVSFDLPKDTETNVVEQVKNDILEIIRSNSNVKSVRYY